MLFARTSSSPLVHGIVIFAALVTPAALGNGCNDGPDTASPVPIPDAASDAASDAGLTDRGSDVEGQDASAPDAALASDSGPDGR